MRIHLMTQANLPDLTPIGWQQEATQSTASAVDGGVLMTELVNLTPVIERLLPWAHE